MTWSRQLFIVLLIGCCNFSAWANSAYEREQMRLILLQLDNIDNLAKQSQLNKSTSVNDRYRFDYKQFNKDIQHIRSGILQYLDPTRAQPRKLYELNTDYLIENKGAE